MTTTRCLLALHAVVTAVSTAIAVGRDLRAAPFGVATGRTASFDAVIGYGTAISAPWPIATAAWIVPAPGLRLAAPVFMIGQLSEPIVWRRRTWRDPVLAVSVICNLILPIAIARSARNDLGTLAS